VQREKDKEEDEDKKEGIQKKSKYIYSENKRKEANHG
jgi:hypothetical protein